MAQGIQRPAPSEHRAQLCAMSSTKKQSKEGPLDFRERGEETEKQTETETETETDSLGSDDAAAESFFSWMLTIVGECSWKLAWVLHRMWSCSQRG